MIDSYSRLARDRLQHLSSNLLALRERVRDAVVREMGKAVGEALRDLLTAILSQTANVGCVVEPQSPPPRSMDQAHWDDDETDWHEEPANAARAEWSPSLSPPAPPPAAVGLGIARWLLKRRVPIWASLSAGLLVGLATLSHHPFVQVSLGVVAAATELLAITEISTVSP